MVKRKVKLANVTGWAGTAAGAFNAHTITLDIPTGPRYHVIWIYGNAGAAKKFTDLIGEIRININGVTQRKFTALELLKLNALNGITQYAGRNGNIAATAFVIPLWFAEPWRKSLRSQDLLAWGTGDVSSFQIEFDIQAYAGAAAGLIAPTFRAEVDNTLVADAQGKGVQAPLGIITKWIKSQIPITQVAGWNEWVGMKDMQGAIQSVHFNDLLLSEYELFVDDLMIRNDTIPAGNNAAYAGREMNPDPVSSNDCPLRSMTDLVFDHDDILENALPLSANGVRAKSVLLRLLESGGASRNITTVFQVIGNVATS
jgi:hypothetical protein